MEVDGSWNSNTDGGNGSVEINVSSRAYSHVFALVTGPVERAEFNIQDRLTRGGGFLQPNFFQWAAKRPL